MFVDIGYKALKRLNTQTHTRNMSEKQEDNGQHKRKDRWFLLIIFLVFLTGLSIRGYGYATRTESRARTFQSQTSPDYTQKAFPGTSGETQTGEGSYGYPEEDGLFTVLAPYLTEGGLSFFIGFCIGYFLRFVAKATIIVVGGLYFCLILLSHYGLIIVDWGSIQQFLQQILLNTQTQLEGLRGTIAVGIPSMAMGGLGIWRGLKKS